MARWLDGEKMSFNRRRNDVNDEDCLIAIGSLFQIVGAATLKALEPMTVETEGWTRRSRSDERRDLTGV